MLAYAHNYDSYSIINEFVLLEDLDAGKLNCICLYIDCKFAIVYSYTFATPRLQHLSYYYNIIIIGIPVWSQKASYSLFPHQMEHTANASN